MLLKARSESKELQVLRSLHPRMELTEKEKNYYLSLEKGYEGELRFDHLAKDLQEERFIINDLLLQVNNSYFQIDSLLISQGIIHLLDIKNFEGEFYLEADNLFSVKTGREYKNPVIQLNRAATLFRQLLRNLKYNYLVEASVVYVNPEFTLYQAPMDQPFILPTQVNSFLRGLNTTPSVLNDGHQNLAQKLLSLHQTKNPYTQLPEYEYDQLQKGVYCRNCKSFQVTVGYAYIVCKNCGQKESYEQAILRNVKEFTLLFPERRITTVEIYEWCKVDISQKTIQRILKKNFTQVGKTSDTYYRT